MPRLSVWMVKASLLHMGAGFLFGGLILFQKGIPFDGTVWRLLTPHIDMMIFGWTMQCIMGVAFWILPRFTHEPRHGRVLYGWTSFALLNAGVLLTGAGSWWALAEWVAFGRMLTLVAVILFAILIFPRVKPYGA